MQWMVTSEFRESRHFKSEMGQYAFQTLTSLDWWNNMKYVLDDVEPLYSFLRFADQDKVPTLGEVHVQYQNTKLTYTANLSQTNLVRLEQIIDIIDSRMCNVMLGTYVQAASALNPLVNYTMGTSESLMVDLRRGLERMVDTNKAALALQEAEFFKQKRGDFSGELARRLAVDRSTSPASWWSMFGGGHTYASGTGNEASLPVCIF